MERKSGTIIRNLIILGLLAVIIIQSYLYINTKKDKISLEYLNQLDAYGVVNEYLLAHETGEKGLLTLRLLDEFYDKSEDYLLTHSDVFNIESISIKNIEEVKLDDNEIEEIKLRSKDRNFASPVNVEEIKKYNVEYKFIPIDEQKGFIIDEADRKEEIILVKRYGIWKIFELSNT